MPSNFWIVAFDLIPFHLIRFTQIAFVREWRGVHTNKGSSKKRNDTNENKRNQYCLKKEKCDVFISQCTVIIKCMINYYVYVYIDVITRK